MKSAAWACALFLMASAAGVAASPQSCLLEAAREQIGVTLSYDASYMRLNYPGGDVPLDRGVCTDVLVRAYRKLGVDLQEKVHDDISRAWDAYPKSWGLRRPDSNIDHRRVPNLAVFFARHGSALPVGNAASGFLPGDIVTWRLPSGVPHIGLVSERRAPSGRPLIVHNIGRGTVEEDALFAFVITGHYRYLPDHLTVTCSADATQSP